jgi:WD40 repeat protein
VAQIRRRRPVIAAALLALAALSLAPARAQDQGPKTDLYDHPVLAIDPGMHTAPIRSQAVDVEGRYAVTGGDDRTVRIWSLTDGRLVRTIWIPVGPERVGDVHAVAISPDGSTIAVGGWTGRSGGASPIYLFNRESGGLIRRIDGDLPDVTLFLTFSPDGRYLAATLGDPGGLRVFDRDKDWSEAFRDGPHRADSYCAAFSRDGRLAAAADDGFVRLYQYDPKNDNPNLRRVGIQGLSGGEPASLAFNPDGRLLAVGYYDVAAIDVLDGMTLDRIAGPSPTGIEAVTGAARVAWSRDGQILFAAGAMHAAGDHLAPNLLFAWDWGGLQGERRITYCEQTHTAAGVDTAPNGQVLVASMAPCLGLMNARGEPIWTVPSPILDFRWQTDEMRVSENGKVVDFGYGYPGQATLRFDLGSLTMSDQPTGDSTFAPRREGLKVEGWRNGTAPTLDGRVLPFARYDKARSLAVAPDAKRFYLGSRFTLQAFDDSGAPKWHWLSRSTIWAVNASQDDRVVVSADGDGAIRWHRADDGRELLTLQVLPNGKPPAEWDWVLWTPEGFYEATPGAENVLKWVANHGPNSAASVLPVSAIAKLHRPNALPHVLDQLETAHALGVDDITVARLDVQKATGSAKPPGGALNVLAIGVDDFGDKAEGLHLDYAAEDAHDVATALMNSQKGGPGKASLYADVKVAYLPNEKADGAAILDALDAMADSLAKSGSDQDVAVILFSSHGEMIDGQFYLIPHGFDAGSKGRSVTTAVSASQFGERIGKIAAHAKVLLLLDACYSGAVGAQAWAKDPDAKVLEDALDIDNVTVLTSSRKTENSEELPEWKHGAFAQAFLDALVGAGDSQGIVTVSTLEDAMENEVGKLTRNRQHVGMHRNFSGDLFVAGHY